jgi:hypothetical protein
MEIILNYLISIVKKNKIFENQPVNEINNRINHAKIPIFFQKQNPHSWALCIFDERKIKCE